MMKRILIISHAYVEEANWAKIELLSQFDDLEVGVLTPESWRTWHGEDKNIANSKPACAGRSQISNVERYKRLSLPVYFSGDAGLYFYHPLKLFRLFKEFNPDIIHLEEEPWTPVALETAYYCKKLGKKLLLFSWENIDLYLNFWRKWDERLVLKNTGNCLAGNEGALIRLKEHGFIEGITVLPQFGVDTERFHPSKNDNGTASDSSQAANHFRIGYVGRLTADKGLETLFRAFAKLGKSEAELVLLSSSAKLPEYFRDLAAELKITRQIKLIAGVSHADFPGYIRAFDLQVLPSLTTPSWKEQFGRVMIEGMASGVPIIGSSSGAIPEVLGDSGLLFKEGDSGELYEKMNQLYIDPVLRNKLGEAGQDRVKKLYSYSVIAQKTREIYRSL